jgi:hypothetical protein
MPHSPHLQYQGSLELEGSTASAPAPGVSIEAFGDRLSGGGAGVLCQDSGFVKGPSPLGFLRHGSLITPMRDKHIPYLAAGLWVAFVSTMAWRILKK